MADSTPSIRLAASKGTLRLLEGLIVVASCVLLAGFVRVEPGIAVVPPPPDFASMPVEQKKREFFAYLSPLIAAANFELAADRDRLRAIRAAHARGERIGWFDRRWLERLAGRLEVPIDEIDTGEALAILERRTGIVPESIVLAQAAIESGWGTSRFALEANNFFGQRCYSDGCGVKAEAAPAGADFGLARFASADESVESYIRNLNTHPGYREFRERRLALRSAGEPVTGLALVGGLMNYSERGAEYVADLAALIRDNELE